MRSRQAGKAVDGFRFWLEARGVARNTVRNYVSNVRPWLAWCDEYEIDYMQASRQDFTYFLGDQTAKNLKPTTIGLRLIALHIFYDYLKEECGLKENIAREVHYKRTEGRPTEPFTRNELQRMLDACQSFQERAIYLLLMGGGMRRHEIYSITKSDVNFETRQIRVLGKGRQYRFVAPGPLVIEALRFALEFEEHLCPFASDDYVWRTVKRIAKRANIKGRIHPHRFRHTFGVYWIMEGGDEGSLQMIFGHKRLDQTHYYAKAARAQVALSKMDEMNLAERLLS